MRGAIRRRGSVGLRRVRAIALGEAIKRGRVGLRRARAIALGEAATVLSGVAAAAMFSGTVYCNSATGGTNSNKLGYGYHDSARVFSAVSAIRILSQKSELDPGGIAMTQKYRSAQSNLSGDPMTVLPGTRMGIKNNQVIDGRPQEDSAMFRLIKDGLRAVTGLVRRNQVDFPIGPASGPAEATMGVRGSSGETWQCTQGPQCTRHAMLHGHDAVHSV